MTANVDEYFKSVEEGTYPANPIVWASREADFTNEAGSIRNIAWGNFGSASQISSVGGSIRSNHRHREDWHFIYLLSGMMIYYHRPVGANQMSRHAGIPGSLIFTAPKVDHATYFVVESTMVTFQKRRRDHENHEGDLIRVPPMIALPTCPSVFDGRKCVLPMELEGRNWEHPHHSGDHLDERGLGF